MAKKKSIYAIIENDIYPYDLMVSFNESDKVFKERLLKYGVDYPDRIDQLENEPPVMGRTALYPSGETVLRLNFFPVTPKEIGLLQHEIFHAVDFILGRVGFRLVDGSEEAYAYLTQFFTTKIHELLKK